MAAEQTELSLPSVVSTGRATLFRYSSYDVPFWVLPNTRAGRWHCVGDPPTQYWSGSPDAAWAELIRSEELRLEEDLDLLRMPLWAGRFPLAEMVDLQEPAAMDSTGLTAEDLVGEDWAACQEAGSAMRRSRSGVIAPSAALDGHASVTMFGARRMIDWRQRPALASAVPAAVVAIGRPRRGLLEKVRHRADPAGSQRLF